jgi:hypothetical protein
MAEQKLVDKILNRIYGHGKGWVFSTKDFADLGPTESVSRNLRRLSTEGKVVRVFRGIFLYPEYSTFLEEQAPPDPNAIALAISRIRGETITASGLSALNQLGLSTQVPAIWEYMSDGPSREYEWQGGLLKFTHQPNKELTSLSSATALLVQALKALGERNITPEVIQALKRRLTKKEKENALQEARYTTAWIYEAIKKIAKEEDSADA